MQYNLACILYFCVRAGANDILDWAQKDFCSEPVWIHIREKLELARRRIEHGDLDSAAMILEEPRIRDALADSKISLRCASGSAGVLLAMADCFNSRDDSIRALRVRQLAAIFLSFDYQMKGHEWIENSGWSVSWGGSVDALIGGMKRLIAADINRDQSMKGLMKGIDITDGATKRIAIVSVCDYDGDVTPLAEFSRINKRIYADKHKYDLVFFNKAPTYSDYFTKHGNMYNSRPPAWSKIDAVLNVMVEDTHDWVMWIDCDSYFMDMDVSLSGVIDAALRQRGSDGAENELVSVVTESIHSLKEWRPPVTASSSEAFQQYGELLNSLTQNPDRLVHLIASEDGLMLNTGIFFIRRSVCAFASLLQVRQLLFNRAPVTFHPWWEQTGIILVNLLPFLLEKDRWELAARNQGFASFIHLLSQKQLNTYPPMIAGMLRTHEAFEAGDFIVSFSGCKVYTSQSVCNSLFVQYFLQSIDGKEVELPESIKLLIYG